MQEIAAPCSIRWDIMINDNAEVSRFCTLIMAAGRKQIMNPSELYALSQVLYWDLRRIVEGRYRLFHDQKLYERLIADPNFTVEYSPHEQAKIEKRVDEEIRSGCREMGKREGRIRELKREESREFLNHMAAEESTKRVKVPGEYDVVSLLLFPDTTPEQIREVCKEATMTVKFSHGSSEAQDLEVPAWPISPGSILPDYLSRHAEKFTQAKRHPKFPRGNISRRPTTLWKQLWFLSRALAAAELGVETRTAINRVGALRPEELFAGSRDGKTVRRHRRRIMPKR
jgi:hypothetical protein